MLMAPRIRSRLLRSRFFGGLIPVLLLAAPAWAGSHDPGHQQHDETHAHSHHQAESADHGTLTLSRNNGESWATDDALREGMTRLRTTFATAHSEYRAGNLDRAAATALAERVDGHLQFIIANCDLPPDADAELHKLLYAAFDATAALRELDDPHVGLHGLHEVLDIYGAYFKHEGWPDQLVH